MIFYTMRQWCDEITSELKAFKNKTVDIYFTRDNIYLRLMENQQVKDVRSLYSILTSVAEVLFADTGYESYFDVSRINPVNWLHQCCV